MRGAGRVSITTELQLTPRQIATAFCDLGDEAQAQVLIEVADIAASWGWGDCDQWYLVGRHLRNCDCSNDDTRDLVRRIFEGMSSGRVSSA